MSSLLELTFDEMEGAEKMGDRMFEFQRRELFTLEVAAVAVRLENGKTWVPKWGSKPLGPHTSTPPSVWRSTQPQRTRG